MNNESFKVGWREYAELPELGINHIHVKIDTGARTSAIHAVKHELFKKADQEWVRAYIAPNQDDDETLVVCELPVKDQRVVTSSNGHQTERIVIETQLVMGKIKRMIELTLTSRDTMKYRMLLGRQAMQGMTVIPTQSYLMTE